MCRHRVQELPVKSEVLARRFFDQEIEHFQTEFWPMRIVTSSGTSITSTDNQAIMIVSRTASYNATCLSPELISRSFLLILACGVQVVGLKALWALARWSLRYRTRQSKTGESAKPLIFSSCFVTTILVRSGEVSIFASARDTPHSICLHVVDFR